jgi:hypothetical protein
MICLKRFLYVSVSIVCIHDVFAQAEVQNTSFPFWKTRGNSGTNTGTNFIGTTDNFSLAFRTNDIQRVIIDSFGRVGVQTPTPVAPLDVAQTNGSSNFTIVTTNYGNPNDVLLSRAQGTITAPTLIGSGGLGVYSRLIARGYDGTGFRTAAQIAFEVDAATGANDMPGRITFWTTPDGSTTTQERIRIEHTGEVGIGTTNPQRILQIGGATNTIRIEGLATGGSFISAPAATTDRLLFADATGDVRALNNGSNGQTLQIVSGFPQWSSGLVGPTGPTGAAGTNGATGAAGPTGPTGPTGAAGANGANGAAGATGTQGAIGPTGAAGTNGATGAAGPTGAAGTNGATGATGPQGPIGPTGPSGSGSSSAWDLTGNTGTTASTSAIGTAVNNNFIGTTDTKDLVFATNNLERMRLLADGRFGLGTSNPLNSDTRVEFAFNGPWYTKLTSTSGDNVGLDFIRTGGRDWRIVNDGGNFTIFTTFNDFATPPTDGFRFNTGLQNFYPLNDNVRNLGQSANRWKEIFVGIAVINTSDVRQKENIYPIQYGLSQILKLNPVQFTWIQHPMDGLKLGLIAQELKTVLPEVVKDWEWKVDEKTGERTKVEAERMGVMYSDIIPVLIKAIQEQEANAQKMREEIEILKREITKFEKKYNKN